MSNLFEDVHPFSKDMRYSNSAIPTKSLADNTTQITVK